MNTPAELIRNARLQAGLTLQALGERVGVGPSFISNVEQGRDALPQRLIPALAHALHLNEAKLEEAVARERARSPQDRRQVEPLRARVRKALLPRVVGNVEPLRTAFRKSRKHPVDQQILGLLSAVLDELMVNWIPDLEALWAKGRRLGFVNPDVPRDLTAMYGHVLRYVLWDDVALAVLSVYQRDLQIGHRDRAETAARLVPYLAGVPLRWYGFEDAVEQTLRDEGCPLDVINHVLKRTGEWETAPRVTDASFQPCVDALWEHRRQYVLQAGLASPHAALTAFTHVLADPAFAIDGLFEDYGPTSILLDHLTYDPSAAALVLGYRPTPNFHLAFLEARRQLFATGAWLAR